ncbi:MAG: hypothetical protein CBE11_03950 [Rickettsiales bacterium TMED251]|nr:MAG: hypothetical protein CBE11_03950 [Rickettsiales bacterium TMED251]
MKFKKVLVIGADGFIGSHLSEKLVKTNFDVTTMVVYNSFGSIGWLNDLPKKVLREIDIVFGDITDEIFIRNSVKNFDIVFNLAALISIPHSYISPKSYLTTNINGTINLLEASRLGNIDRLIHTSTSEVYGSALYTPINEEHKLQAQSPYAASKISADHFVESYVKTFNLPIVIHRPFNTYGPRQTERAIIPSIIRQCIDKNIKKITVGNTKTIRDFNYVTDTVNAFIELSTSKNIKFGVPYNSGSGKGISIQNILKKILKYTNCKKDVFSKRSLVRPKHSEVLELICDASRIRSTTHWNNKVDIDKGINLTINWWKRNLDKLKNNSTKRMLD